MINEIINEIKKNLGEDYNVTYEKATLHNRENVDVICIGKKKDGIAIRYTVPAVIEKSAEDMARNYVSSFLRDVAKGLNVDLAALKKWEDCKEKVYYRVLGLSGNEKYLENKVYTKHLNLAKVFILILEDGAAATITDDLLKDWGVTIADLEEAAERNNKNAGYEAFGLSSEEWRACVKANIKAQRLEEGEDEAVAEAEAEFISKFIVANTPENPMCIAKNNIGICGANIIADNSVLSDLEERFGSGFYILPSSIYEIICLPLNAVGNDASPSDLFDMVKSVNAEELDKSEKLSDSLYKYEDGKLSVVMTEVNMGVA